MYKRDINKTLNYTQTDLLKIVKKGVTINSKYMYHLLVGCLNMCPIRLYRRDNLCLLKKEIQFREYVNGY